MRHSEDDAVHKNSHELKICWQNQLKSLVLIHFQVLYNRPRDKEVDVIFNVQCP